MFTDIANGINLYMGPDPNTTVNETEEANGQGRITKPHPTWGVMMLSIPFLPMMVIPPFAAIGMTEREDLCTRLVYLLFAIALAFPFTAVATPIYVLFVVGVGVIGVISPRKGEDYKQYQGMLKTGEISLESAIQTCLGKNQPLFTL